MQDIKKENITENSISAKEIRFNYSIGQYLIECSIVEVTDKEDYVQWFQVRDKFSNVLVEGHKILQEQVLRQFHITKETQQYITTDGHGRFYYGKQSED